MSAWAAHRLKRYQLPNYVYEQYDTLPDTTPIRLPKIKMNFNMKLPKNLNIISKVINIFIFVPLFFCLTFIKTVCPMFNLSIF